MIRNLKQVTQFGTLRAKNGVNHMTTTIARSLFTTEHLTNVSARMLAWQESVSFIFHVDPVHDPARYGFHARIESYFFGSLVTSICESVPAHWRRTVADAAVNGLDHFLIQFYIRGHAWMVDGHREIRTDPGEVVVLDAARTIHTRTEDFRNFTLWVPRQLVAERMENVDDLHGLILSADAPLTILLREHLLQLHEQASAMPAIQGERMVEPTVDLLVSALKAGGRSETRKLDDPYPPPLISLKQYIHRQLDNPDLDIERITRDMNVSRATLYRISEPLGGIMQYIRQRRLDKALQALTNPDLQHLSVAQIAGFWGFEDASAFHRLLRRQFDISPREARRLPYSAIAARQRGAPAGDTSAVTGDRLYESWLACLCA